jgi:hypothetical protein
MWVLYLFFQGYLLKSATGPLSLLYVSKLLCTSLADDHARVSILILTYISWSFIVRVLQKALAPKNGALSASAYFGDYGSLSSFAY